MIYVSKDGYWLSSYRMPYLFRTSCTGVGTKVTSTIWCTLRRASRYIIIPWVLYGMTDDWSFISSTSNMSWCTVCHITLSLALASPVLILSLKQWPYSRLAGQFPFWRTWLLIRGNGSLYITILMNGLHWLRHSSPHLAFWSITVSELLYSCMVTDTFRSEYVATENPW